MSSVRAIVVDTETTNKDCPEVIELAWVEFLIDSAARTGDDSFESRFVPNGPITTGAAATHHILPCDLSNRGYPPSETAPECLPDGCEYIIGHNVDFDWNALGCPDVKRICTLAISRYLWEGEDSYSQSALIYSIFGMEPNIRNRLQKAHSAMVDVLNCALLTKHIVFASGVQSIEELWQLSEKSRIPKVMPFGKHKGEPIDSIPDDYRSWLLRQSDVDPYLLKALEK